MTRLRTGAAPDLAAGTPQQPPARAAVAGLATRLIRRGTLVVAVVVAGMSAFVVVQYRVTFAGALDSGSLAALAANPAIRALFGVPAALDDPGGFTVWRTGTPIAVLVSIWALLSATGVTRGEEDAGRWALLLAGRLRLDELVSRHLVVLAAAQAVVGVPLAAAMLLTGTRPAGALLYATGMALVGTTFAAVGVLAAQLVADRRLAAGLAGAALAASLMLRMVADGVDALAWSSWASPLGLLARVEPYAADRPLPLAVLALVDVVVGALAVRAARHRDVEAGLWSASPTRRPRLLGVRTLPSFAARRSVRGVLGWSVGLAAYFTLIGSLAPSMTRFMTDNPRFAELAARAGVTGLASVEGFAAALFGLLAVPLGIYAAARISADAVDEAERRFALVFGLPVSRTRWALTHAAVVTAGCLMLAVVTAVATWLGAQVAGAPLALAPALAGTLNSLPIAVVCLGSALLALGWAPRTVLAVGSLPAVGGYLLLVLTETFGWPRWLRAVSPFDHTAAVPVAPVDWPGTAGLLLGAAVLAAVGVLGYARRDLTT